MTVPARNVEVAAGAVVPASEGLQDIWGQASRYVSQHHANSGRDRCERGGLAGYTELCESIDEFKIDSVRQFDRAFPFAPGQEDR
jgi:hypothetical protein